MDQLSAQALRVEEIRFERAEQLVAALRPECPLWSPEPGAWVFRGHADGNWRLLPSAQRQKALRRFVSSVVQLKAHGEYCEPRVADVENLLNDFALALDAAGHPTPGSVRDGARLSREGAFADPHHKLAALGQHYGLPTMLLDWTRVGTYAAYFAASEVADLGRSDSEGVLDIWALNAKDNAVRGKVGGVPFLVQVVEPPRVGNPNLHSQRGVFTLNATDRRTWDAGDGPAARGCRRGGAGWSRRPRIELDDLGNGNASLVIASARSPKCAQAPCL